MNKRAVERIGWILQQMKREATKRDAAVFRAEHSTRDTPFKILVFTLLSARTKDETTMKVVTNLFKVADTPKKVASLGQKKLEKLLYGVGFHKVKAKHLLEASKMVERLGGVPDTLEGIMELPGVGRKTGNIVLARAYGKNTLGVDVHVHRISNRLGLVKTEKPEDTEKELVRILPSRYLRTLNRDFVAYGQTVCLPRNPECDICPISKLCQRVGVSSSLR